MKALTIRQPWAHLIAIGKKTVEIRSWATKYRGPLLITASAKAGQESKGLSTGCTVCLVDLVDCRTPTRQDPPRALCDVYEEDMVWVLTNPRPLPPVPVKGKLSIWTPPPELLAALDLA